jgi:hypothetical protein
MQFIRFFVLKPLAVFGAAVLLFSTQAFALSKLDEDLLYQSNFGKAEKVRALLQQGANPNATDQDKWPAISLATMRGDDEGEKIVQLLVSAGADLNVRDANDETPLMNAISVNNAALVKYMIERGADFHATNPSGRTVQAFAKHYANDNVAELVDEAIRLENQRIIEGRSRKRMYRMMDDYIYYNCAISYISYNKALEMYPKEDNEKIERLFTDISAKINNAQVELEHNFWVRGASLRSMGQQVQDDIIQELESLISRRNRIKLGVGTDTDLDKRCKNALEGWRISYSELENKGVMKDRE